LDHLIESQEIFQRALVKAFPTFERQLILERQLSSNASGEDNHAKPLGIKSAGPFPATSPDTVNDQEMTEYVIGDYSEREEARETTPTTKSRSGIPPDHTTGWSGILQWQAVGDIVGEILRDDDLACDPLGSENERELLIFNNYSSQNYDGASGLDYSTVKQHTESYLSYFAIMHPILDPTVIGNLVDEYWTALRDVKLIFTEPHFMLPWNPSQSIDVAILLLVVALGQSCERALDRVNLYEGSPDSEFLGELALERTLGFTFFSAAIVRLGRQVCGNTIQHVQAYVLAGLYYGQLTRILESHSYYSNASRVLYMILKP
jgi:hypothetical protein